MGEKCTGKDPDHWDKIIIDPAWSGTIEITFLLKTKNKNVGGLFLQSIKNIDTIKLEKSISLFHDINEIFIIFHEKIYKPSFNTNVTNNKTKKVFINSNTNKYTKRKPFKENIL